MTMYVLIEHKPHGKVTASLIGWPDMTAQGGTEAEAVRALRRSFTTHLQDAKVIPLDLAEERPWLATVGMFTDDPFSDELDALIADYRRECDTAESSPPVQDYAASSILTISHFSSVHILLCCGTCTRSMMMIASQ